MTICITRSSINEGTLRQRPSENVGYSIDLSKRKIDTTVIAASTITGLLEDTTTGHQNSYPINVGWDATAQRVIFVVGSLIDGHQYKVSIYFSGTIAETLTIYIKCCA